MRMPTIVVIGAALCLALVGCSSDSQAQDTTSAASVESQEDQEVDKSGLEEAVDEAESVTIDKLSSSTYEKLSNAYDEAKAVLEDDDAKQYEVDAKQRALLSALDSAEAESESHTDEFTIVDAYLDNSALSYGYFDIVLVVQNNTDETLEFQGVDVAELDADGNILDSYMSYNKNAVDTMVDPGQQLSVQLTCSVDDGIAGVRCTEYEYGLFSSLTTGVFSETFTKMF